MISGQFDVTLTTSVIVDPPTIFASLDTKSVSKDWPTSQKFGVVSLINLERTDVTVSFSIASGDDSSYVNVYGLGSGRANVVLTQSLSSLSRSTLVFTVVATFSSTSQVSAPAPVQQRFSVSVIDVHVAPVFEAFPQPVPVQIDETPGTVVLDASASGSGSLVYSLSNVQPAKAGSLFAIEASSGAVSVTDLPSNLGLAIGTYTAVLSVSDGLNTTSVDVTFEIRDNCYVADGGDDLCSGNGVCVNGFKSFTCQCNKPFSGDYCDQVASNPSANAAHSDLGSGATVGVVIAAVAGLLLVVLVVLVDLELS